MNWDRNIAQQFGEDLILSLNAVAAKYGMTVKYGKRYLYGVKQPGELKYTIGKTEFWVDNGDSVMEQDFRRNAPNHGFNPDDIGRRFYYKEVGYEIVGWKNNNKKHKLLAKNDKTGKLHKWHPYWVLQHII